MVGARYRKANGDLKDMDKRIIGVIAFLVLLCIYVTVLVALAPILPVLCLASVAPWVVIRRPFKYPGRMEDDLRRFSHGLADGVEKLLRALFQPLRDDSFTASSRDQNNGSRHQ